MKFLSTDNDDNKDNNANNARGYDNSSSNIYVPANEKFKYRYTIYNLWGHLLKSWLVAFIDNLKQRFILNENRKNRNLESCLFWQVFIPFCPFFLIRLTFVQVPWIHWKLAFLEERQVYLASSWLFCKFPGGSPNKMEDNLCKKKTAITLKFLYKDINVIVSDSLL